MKKYERTKLCLVFCDIKNRDVFSEAAKTGALNIFSGKYFIYNYT